MKVLVALALGLLAAGCNPLMLHLHPRPVVVHQAPPPVVVEPVYVPPPRVVESHRCGWVRTWHGPRRVCRVYRHYY